jgi:AcrR family transcriptional regulator
VYESGTALGKPAALYWAPSLNAKIIANAQFQFTPFSNPDDWYTGKLIMNRAKTEPSVLSVSISQTKDGARHYIDLTASLEIVEPGKVVWPVAMQLQAARRVFALIGYEATTVRDIIRETDLASGTFYNYFKSKDELAIAVLETLMHDLALRIQEVTDTFEDPAQVYAFGIRTVLDTATTDMRWAQMLNRSEVIADAMFRMMGPFAIRDLRLASQAGRFEVSNAELVWRLTTHALIGASLAITTGQMPASASDQIIMRLLCMTGIGANAATELAGRPRPALKPERDRSISSQ